MAFLLPFSLSLFISLQTLAPAPPAFQRIDVTTGMSAARVTPGGTTSLWLDITPKPGMHVYAPGAKGFEAISLVVSPRPGIVVGRVTYPASMSMPSPGTAERVPVYVKPFRLVQPISISKTVKVGEAIPISGVVNYQTCDDRLCYPRASIGVRWSVVPGR
jgi:DsbC/DsbD-like thiol-disulfide interchange protein